MKKEHPILMSIPMAIATENGKKTMTRRLSGLDWPNENPDQWELIIMHPPIKGKGLVQFKEKNGSKGMLIPCPYGQIGDLLFVRENFRMVENSKDGFSFTLEYGGGYKKDFNFETVDQADWFIKHCSKLLKKGILIPDEEQPTLFNKFTDKKNPWIPSIHLPKWASYHWLEITEITCERLQDISESDAISEGISILFNTLGEKTTPRYKDYMADASGYGDPKHDFPTVSNAWESFKTLWESINGEGSWFVNPWVWVVKFKKVKK